MPASQRQGGGSLQRERRIRFASAAAAASGATALVLLRKEFLTEIEGASRMDLPAFANSQRPAEAALRVGLKLECNCAARQQQGYA